MTVAEHRQDGAAPPVHASYPAEMCIPVADSIGRSCLRSRVTWISDGALGENVHTGNVVLPPLDLSPGTICH